jgi:hypothetical protein
MSQRRQNVSWVLIISLKFLPQGQPLKNCSLFGSACKTPIKLADSLNVSCVANKLHEQAASRTHAQGALKNKTRLQRVTHTSLPYSSHARSHFACMENLANGVCDIDKNAYRMCVCAFLLCFDARGKFPSKQQSSLHACIRSRASLR